jgi:hypothetical protein
MDGEGHGRAANGAVEPIGVDQDVQDISLSQEETGNFLYEER